MAYADEIAAANRLKTLEERFAARNAVRAKYGMEPEQKTRGGIAGAYDRNKKVIGAGATALGYLFGGPAGAAVARGTMQGLDRPGEGGIGFDVGRAGKGAAEGYSAGQVANIGKAGLSRLFAPSGGTTAAMTPAVTPATAPGGGGMPLSTLRNQQEERAILDFAKAQPPAPLSSVSAGSIARPSPVMSVPTSAYMDIPLPPEPSKFGQLLRATGRGAANVASGVVEQLKKPEVLAPLAGGVADVLGAAQDRAAKQAEVRLKEQELRLEQERQARLAQLLMPLFEQQIGRAGRTR